MEFLFWCSCILNVLPLKLHLSPLPPFLFFIVQITGCSGPFNPEAAASHSECWSNLTGRSPSAFQTWSGQTSQLLALQNPRFCLVWGFTLSGWPRNICAGARRLRASGKPVMFCWQRVQGKCFGSGKKVITRSQPYPCCKAAPSE